jgi:hypothetical protein
LVRSRLGDLGVAVFDMRMTGGETKSLVGSLSLGSPGKYVIKRLVQQIKQLAKKYATSRGDEPLLRRIEKAMAEEAATVQKRLQAGAGRRVGK